MSSSHVPLLLAALLPVGGFTIAQETTDAPPPPRPQGSASVPGDAQGDGLSREEMWRAPTTEEWQKPCLITWQRTWDDAVSVSKETKKAILVCVNMDGEIASEHYAGVRYRQPEIAALYKPYVTVIASVYRHSPRDHDEEGRRVLCPRFGSVTCGEHIAIEPILYEKFLDGQRVAPRHIMVELDGSESYDVFYAFDTRSVFRTVVEGIEEREIVPPPDTRGDLPLIEKVASSDVLDRIEVEKAYVSGDKAQRRQLLGAALRHRDLSHTDLLRLAIFGLDADLARLAREALAEATDEGAIDLIAEALRVPMEAAEREALIAALDRLGASWPRAATLAAVHRGLNRRSGTVDAETWARALEEAGAAKPRLSWSAIESQLDYRTELASTRPEDPMLRLELAEASLELAIDPETKRALAADPKTAGTYSRLMFQDAQLTALRAEELGVQGWRVDATIGLAAYYLGELEQAYARAEKAVAALPAGDPGWNAMAVVAVFAEARQKAIAKAIADKTEWPEEWLTDVNAAYSVLAKHPLASADHVVTHHDFLRGLGAHGRATIVLDEGLRRFPESWMLHDRLRGRILREKGVEGLESVYESMLGQLDAPPNLAWFAGYASIVAAEFQRRRSQLEEALAAYDRAIAHYDRSIQSVPETRDTANHYAALALAGRARLAMEGGDLETAVTEVVASFERGPNAAASLDGLGVSPVMTATTLLARLGETRHLDLVQKLQAAIDGLDPVMLEPPAFETPGRPRFNRRRPGQQNR